MKQIIAIDAMGGDFGPEITVPACLSALDEHAELELILVGLEDELRAALGDKANHPRLRIQHATQVVESHEPPAQALRSKKDSSMRVAINLVKEGLADACVSAGNTGALMATAKFVLRTLPGIDRPAICTSIPSLGGYGHTHMLDLGANVDCSAEHLFQFAVMGSVLVKAVDNVENPKVGLLNIGSEDIKGNDQVKEAGRLLEASSLNYIGFVEGDDIYLGDVDVVVTDGFTGNVSLKTSEGVAKMVSASLKAGFKQNLFTKLAALVAMPVLKAFRKRFDPRRYNGASLLGLQGIVVKSHGGADAFSFSNAIKIAMLEVEKAVPSSIDKELETLLNKQSASAE